MNPTSSAVSHSYHRELHAAKKAYKTNQTTETAKSLREVVEKAIRFVQESQANLNRTVEGLIRENPKLAPRAPSDKVQKTGRIHFHKELFSAKKMYEEHKNFLTARKYKNAVEKAIQVAQIKLAVHTNLQKKLLAYENSQAKARLQAEQKTEKNPLSLSDEF